MMNDAQRKRTLLETTISDNIRLIKVVSAAKENIPPAVCETNSPVKRKTCLQDVEVEASTPKKSRECLDEPSTPSSNFKLLTSLAASLEYANCNTSKINKVEETLENQMSCDSDISDLSVSKVNRKEKSLGIICTRFLSMYPTYPKSGEKITISLDEASVQLCVERRRLYDIVNVFESIHILTKVAKNQYLWYGKNFLVQSLSELKITAEKENLLEKLQYVIKLECNPNCKPSCILNEVQNFNKSFEFPDSANSTSQISLPDTRREKSLGIMSQKFLMLFLVSPNKIISLGVAAKVLNGFLHRNDKGAQIKTQIRRLYDIANVLSSIGLIKKENAFSQCGRKPAFKYIGPDLKDFKGDIALLGKSPSNMKSGKPGFVRHSSFQEICAVAEIEHQKLNLEESHNSAPPFNFALTDKKKCVKTSFENLELSKCTNSNNNYESVKIKPKVKTHYIVKPNLKLINLPRSTSSSGPFYIINNVNTEKLERKQSNMGSSTQTYLLINTVPTSKEIKTGMSENSPINKTPSPQTITISSQQRDAILQSLNISLSSEQMAAIHLDGDSQSNNSDTPLNVIKIMHKSKSGLGSATNVVKLSSPKEGELNGINTRSNSSSSMQALDSPLTIPSGYVTPVPNVSSDISFVSNVEVNDILKKIENQSSFEGLHKIKASNEENIEISNPTTRSSDVTVTAFSNLVQNSNSNGKIICNNYPTNNNGNTKMYSTNQETQLISNDSYSSDSLNSEVSNILNYQGLNNPVKPKPFLIDEKTLLSPIKTSSSPLPVNLITPPYMAPETIFFFGNYPISYQTALNDITNVDSTVPKSNSVNKKKHTE